MTPFPTNRPLTALVLADQAFHSNKAKTAHGLVRGTDRFKIRGVIDSNQAGKDAGFVLDGKNRGIPIFASLQEAIAGVQEPVGYCVVGVATHGGRIPPEIRTQILESLRAGITVVSGLHEFISDDREMRSLAEERGLALIDVRKPAPRTELHFWTGEILKVQIPIVAVLGTDCALGKRTTTRLLLEHFRKNNRSAEMIYTGQTGWMQGGRFGLIFDSLPNDFVSGELEHAIVTCAKEAKPELILIEGQSGLQNPAGPCGAEFVLSGNAKAIVLQHAPARKYFDGLEDYEYSIPGLEHEIQLLAMYGARVIAISVNEGGMKSEAVESYCLSEEKRLGIPVVAPLAQGVEKLAHALEEYRKGFVR